MRVCDTPGLILRKNNGGTSRTGAPDPLYDKEGIVYGFTIDDKDSTGVYVEDPRYYPESPFYDPVLASKVHLVHSEFDDPE